MSVIRLSDCISAVILRLRSALEPFERSTPDETLVRSIRLSELSAGDQSDWSIICSSRGQKNQASALSTQTHVDSGA